MNAHEEYAVEQQKRNLSRVCYTYAQEFWEDIKVVFGEGKEEVPYIQTTSSLGEIGFELVCGSEDDVEEMIEATAVREGEEEVVIFPIQLQEWYYREPRYSDEYVRYQLGRVMEEYVVNKELKGQVIRS